MRKFLISIISITSIAFFCPKQVDSAEVTEWEQVSIEQLLPKYAGQSEFSLMVPFALDNYVCIHVEEFLGPSGAPEEGTKFNGY